MPTASRKVQQRSTSAQNLKQSQQRRKAPTKPPTKSDALPVFKITLVREQEIPFTHRLQVRHDLDIARIAAKYFEGLDREHFIVFLLDAKNRLFGLNTVSIGSLTSAIVQPREVLKPAILANAAAIFVAHNHPSGDPTPSPEDRLTSARIRQAAEALGIRLLDHIVIGENWQQYERV